MALFLSYSKPQSLRATRSYQLVNMFSTSASAKDNSLRTIRLINSLNPARISANCRIDISNTVCPTIEVMDNMRARRPRKSSFPATLEGFFTTIPLTTSLQVQERPWRIPLYGLADPPADLMGLRDQLLQEKLIAVDQLNSCRQILQSTDMPWYAYTIHSLEQPWLLPLDQDINLWIVNNGTARVLRAQTHYKLRWDEQLPLRPLSGLLLVRFERSTITVGRKQRRVLVLRILDVVKPINVHPRARRKYHIPQPGMLVPRSVDASIKDTPWYFDFDLKAKSPNAQALHLLCGNVLVPPPEIVDNSTEKKALACT
ncbi:hypothetical protein AB1N83_005891 [Pleurotus pulmonarius]